MEHSNKVEGTTISTIVKDDDGNISQSFTYTIGEKDLIEYARTAEDGQIHAVLIIPACHCHVGKNGKVFELSDKALEGVDHISRDIIMMKIFQDLGIPFATKSLENHDIVAEAETLLNTDQGTEGE